MPPRKGRGPTTREAARRRQTAMGGKRGYRRRMRCPCGDSFAYQPTTAPAPSQCPSCAVKLGNRCTIYDRDRGIGELPTNLARYLVR